ncbi:hypothetical protein DCS_05130 [Drechmeria coniospora]|uniref:BTB domain-containing protein n=1 Tax=Drechmeria coniospora TaxID=98403 RepID=A0A151GLY7_DRECN|nr:hypothetical protein DCS_05130 [Drechmeria coniospora]KYK58117.1 hypothetical protein DCS_05130 [Drechmeria coniospora]
MDDGQSGDVDVGNSLRLRSLDSHSLADQGNGRQLQALLQRMRAAPSGPNHVDAAYDDFTKIKDRCRALCTTILQDEMRPRTLSNEMADLNRRDSSVGSPVSSTSDQRSSFSGRSLAEVAATGAIAPPDAHLGAIRDWKMSLETLTDAFRTSLLDTYKRYEREATPEMVDLMFNNKRFRKDAIARMRNANLTRVRSAEVHFFPRYSIRFRNYDQVKQELDDIRNLLQSGESGISPNREVEEFAISQRGDAILEFANLSRTCPEAKVLRFRVTSYALAATSPLFARMFTDHGVHLDVHEDEDISGQLPPPPTQYVCQDGTEARLYRMPQFELNHLGAMETLMHAAHLHIDMVPRDVAFDQLVAIAECCMRYKSTSPLELHVEHFWLPQWVQEGAADMPDALLIISYAFGSRQLFTRLSKSAILNLVDDEDLQSKPWPTKIKEKIWAVRSAKVDQLYASCAETIQEYIRPPACDLEENETRPISAAPMQLTWPSRCPKGSHSCDATNLGWMMLIYNEMNLLPQIMRPTVLGHLPQSPPPRPRSLAQMIAVLDRMPSPASPTNHGGVCDPSAAFRTVVTDIYKSVTGLTLHDISGKSHGWALSKHLVAEPEVFSGMGLERVVTGKDGAHTVPARFPDSVRLRVLSELDQIDDLHAAALMSHDFYETFRRHELSLLRRFLRAGSMYSRHDDNAENKVLKSESERIKYRQAQEVADAMTLRSEDGGDDDCNDAGYHGDGSDEVGNMSGTGTPQCRELPPHNRPLSSSASPTQAVVSPAAEPTMTEEEARRILWPDSDPETTPAVVPRGTVGCREKFRPGDPSFSGVEEKTLVVMGEKQLRSEHDRRVGLITESHNREYKCGHGERRVGNHSV